MTVLSINNINQAHITPPQKLDIGKSRVLRLQIFQEICDKAVISIKQPGQYFVNVDVYNFFSSETEASVIGIVSLKI